MQYIRIIFLIFIISGCGGKEPETTENNISDTATLVELTNTQAKAFTLTTIKLQKKVISNTLKLNGMVDVPPQNLVSVSTALGGYLKSTKLLPGMHFNKGEIIAVMEDNQYIQLQQDYLTTKAQLQNSQEEFLRQEDLNKSKAGSDKIYQKAKAEYEILQATKKGLEEKLRLININPGRVTLQTMSRTSNIYAPFNGYVTNIFVNTGKYISPSDVMFELVNPDDLHLHLKVFEKDIPKIRVGQHFSAYTNSDPDKKYPGEIIIIGKNLSEDRAVEVHAHFEGKDDNLIPGLYMNADIEVPGNEAMVLPDECIVDFQGGRFVFRVLGGNRFEMIPVNVGNNGNGWTEIKNHEDIGESQIVRSGAYTLLMALKNKSED